MSAKGVFKINGHDYAPYVKAKTGLGWARENTNDEDAGRDAGDVMHPNVKSHQRKLTLKLGPSRLKRRSSLKPTCKAVTMAYRCNTPTFWTGYAPALFYNTSITAAIERFTDEGIKLDDISFTLISVKEATV